MKKLFYCFGILFFILGTVTVSKAEDELLLKSDFKTAYLQYNKALSQEETPINYLNMCKVTLALYDFDTAKKYCNSALKEIEKVKIPDYELKSEILSTIGSIYTGAFRNSDVTFDYYYKAQEYKEKNADTNKYDLAKLYRNMARTYELDNNNNLAEKYWEKALNITEQEQENEFLPLTAIIYNDLAEYSIKNLKYDKAKEYLDKSQKCLETSGEYYNHKTAANLYGNYSKYYEVLKDKNSAIKYSRKKLKENSMYPEVDLLTKENEEVQEDCEIEDVLKKLKEYPYNIDLNVMAGSYYMLKDSKMAENYFNKAINVNPDNTYVYAGIASAYADSYKAKNFKDYMYDAKPYIDMTVKNADYEPDIYLALGTINLEFNHLNKANKYFDEYAKYMEDKSAAYCDIASAIWYNDPKMKYRKYVVKNLEKAQKIKELQTAYKIMLISSYRQTGEKNKADKEATLLIKNEAVFED